MPKVSKMFDPDAPGMNKQLMLDWMHINHPMTPIKTGANKDEVARKVREVQPEFFGNPNGDGSYDAVNQSRNSAPPDSSTSLVTTTPAKRSRSDKKRCASPNDSKTASKKRTVSAKVASTNGPARSAINKKTVRFRSILNGELSVSQSGDHVQSTSQNASNHIQDFSQTPLVEPQKPALSEGATQDQKPVLEWTTRGNQKVNQKVRKTPTPSNNQGTGLFVSSPSLESPMPKLPPTLVKDERGVPVKFMDHTLLGGQRANTNKKDLITFADKDWFEMDNIVNGRDIAPISPNRSTVEELNCILSRTEKKRDGAEVFQDERRRIDQIFALEERMSGVELITGDWKALQDRMMKLEHKAFGEIKRLEEKFKADITALNEEVKRLKSELTKANDTIETCNKALVHILSEGDGEYGPSEGGDNDNDEDEDESSGGSDASFGS
ncbi:uncharacterized protein MELLADRAFT_89760 [Melampsora larici-populina 98AG31]|uniref:Uncharacterized protein n=1 Tax=Melampsora larici-populina (strain 98AG31 / pathotype 3-4-7) TaxID=747676 RepID=F4RUI7_MELLP|nr:uncharacterized protein MELLADRAFT_89760 [Melampsora larici-populina 98AG31]EGG03992.1 hypothetical protein MELLADRAFT_89760 [Melampsora larici-populina 98AG31]